MDSFTVEEVISRRVLPLVAGLVYLPFLGFFLWVGIAKGIFSLIGFCLFALLCLGLTLFRLWTEQRLPKAIFGVLAVFAGSLWLFQSIRRIGFVIREGGMERADGYGSPLAFLIGVVGEGLSLGLPAIFLAAIGLLHRNPPHACSRFGADSGLLRSAS